MQSRRVNFTKGDVVICHSCKKEMSIIGLHEGNVCKRTISFCSCIGETFRELYSELPTELQNKYWRFATIQVTLLLEGLDYFHKEILSRPGYFAEDTQE